VLVAASASVALASTGAGAVSVSVSQHTGAGSVAVGAACPKLHANPASPSANPSVMPATHPRPVFIF
jgi:hypothetical protein